MTSLAATAGRARTRPLLLRPNLLRGLWAGAASGAVVFGIVVLILGVGIPAWAITREGSESTAGTDVPSSLQGGKDLFVTNCGACHTLAAAGTDGVVGPNLDDLLAPPTGPAPQPATIKPRVLSAINNGVAGRMPKGVLSGQQADEVATFVSQVAGQGP